MKIGNLETRNDIFLAPMAGITDLPFRVICSELGAGLVYSEMVSAKGIFYSNQNTKDLLRIDPRERPAGIQIFGSEPEIMGEIVGRLTQDATFDFVDINMGCPAPKIVKNGEGSALMKDSALVGRIIKAVVGASKLPVTVKIRKGFNSMWINAVEIAKIAEACGASAIAVHPRTREQYYAGDADWKVIANVKKAVKIPVIGNGDIKSPQDAKAMFEQTGCDAIMIGRAAQGNPWIFHEITHYLETGEILPPPTNEERLEMALRHARMLIDYKGEHIGLKEMRKHFCWYIKGIKGAPEARLKINMSESLAEIEHIARGLI